MGEWRLDETGLTKDGQTERQKDKTKWHVHSRRDRGTQHFSKDLHLILKLYTYLAQNLTLIEMKPQPDGQGNHVA